MDGVVDGLAATRLVPDRAHRYRVKRKTSENCMIIVKEEPTSVCPLEASQE